MGVSSDTIRARPKAKQCRRHILPQCKQKKSKQQQINSASLSTGEDRVVLTVGELERIQVVESSSLVSIYFREVLAIPTPPFFI